ncbi:hypothetical protein [Laspinema olomoucense]|uniref:hypothetical protein n=1 Tax=Laspinema olomoucense TaxID=3231600 RepID=UPI0021BAFD4B|nr:MULTISPECIES: hypothetical protein [unclassified Laspinema]MCT7973380.1 hypothetical protein [Laspinema sp. D3d]MCT7989063.1 hypothetical protein [Laspinema sp. D3a]MCT7997466.1 hypothetical protein [Laspinema sp. D3c]
MNQFSISSSEALAFQSNYQEMLKLMSELIGQRILKPAPSRPKDNLKIYENSQLIYGRDEEGVFRDELSGLVGRLLDPERVDRLRQLRATPVGEVVPESPNILIILDEQVVLKSDETGRVLTNRWNPNLEEVYQSEVVAETPPVVQADRPSNSTPTKAPELTDFDGFEPEVAFDKDEVVETELPQSERVAETPRVPQGERPSNSPPLNEPELTDFDGFEPPVVFYEDENFLRAVEAGPPEFEDAWDYLDLESVASHPNPTHYTLEDRNEVLGDPEGLEKAVVQGPPPDDGFTTVPEAFEQTESPTEEIGVARIYQQINQLPNDCASLKQLLLLQTRQITQLSEQVQQLNQKQQLDDFSLWIEERTQQPQDIAWWQRSYQIVEKIRERWQSHSQSQQSARSLHELFHRYCDGETYRSRQYQISKQGTFYSLSDSQDQLLVQWQETPFGIQVEQSQLSQSAHQSIERMRSQLLEGKTPNGDFAPDGSSDARYFARVDRVVQTLVRYAQANGGKVEVAGRFHYRWMASAQGQVRIERAKGDGVLLVKSQGRLQSQLNEADLRYFEQMVPALTQKSAAIRKSPADLER